jgi:hypothetical protein
MYSNYGLDAYNTYNTTSTGASLGALAGLGIGLIIFFSLIGIAVGVLELIGLWKMFKKAGRNGWEALIPGHDAYVLFEMAGINPIWILGLVFGAIIAIIPILGIIAFYAFVIFVLVWLNVRLAKSFGKETGYGVLMFFFPYVMYPILGIGSAKYTAPKKMVNKPGEDK